jgi:hypothetical protein
MRQILQLQPAHNSFDDILRAFNKGLPLSSSQINFLRHYHAKFSSMQLDTICRYYGILKVPQLTTQAKCNVSLFSPQVVKNEIMQALAHTPVYQMRLNNLQLLQFKVLLINELIFFHGNRLLITGAPFFPAGVLHAEFFQWGNFYGVIEYQAKPTKNLEGNILLHFEKAQNRSLSEFVHTYKSSMTLIAQPKFQAIDSNIICNRNFLKSDH